MTTLTHGWNANQETEAASRSRITIAICWTFQLAVALMFVMAGWGKLSGAPAMVQVFDAIGIGQWFRHMTGTVEVVSAGLLLAPPVALYGAVLAMATMAGAVFTHVAIIGGNATPALVLFAAAVSVVWIRRSGR